MFPKISLKEYLLELLRPWKLVSLSIGMGYYIWGAIHYGCPTWDIPVSVIMSILTYIFAPWTVSSIYYLLSNRPPKWFLGVSICMCVIYACASGSYELYNYWHLGYWPPPTYWVNLYYSSLMFFGAGMVWKFQGTFMELLKGMLRFTKNPL